MNYSKHPPYPTFGLSQPGSLLVMPHHAGLPFISQSPLRSHGDEQAPTAHSLSPHHVVHWCMLSTNTLAYHAKLKISINPSPLTCLSHLHQHPASTPIPGFLKTEMGSTSSPSSHLSPPPTQSRTHLQFCSSPVSDFGTTEFKVQRHPFLPYPLNIGPNEQPLRWETSILE